MPAYVVFVCRELVDQEELNTYWRRVNGALVGHPARVLIDHSRFLILEGQGPVEGVTVYEFPLVLLCHKLALWQQGQRGSRRAMLRANLMRRLAIDVVTWRSVRIGGSAGSITRG